MGILREIHGITCNIAVLYRYYLHTEIAVSLNLQFTNPHEKYGKSSMHMLANITGL